MKRKMIFLGFVLMMTSQMMEGSSTSSKLLLTKSASSKSVVAKDNTSSGPETQRQSLARKAWKSGPNISGRIAEAYKTYDAQAHIQSSAKSGTGTSESTAALSDGINLKAEDNEAPAPAKWNMRTKTQDALNALANPPATAASIKSGFVEGVNSIGRGAQRAGNAVGTAIGYNSKAGTVRTIENSTGNEILNPMHDKKESIDPATVEGWNMKTAGQSAIAGLRNAPHVAWTAITTPGPSSQAALTNAASGLTYVGNKLIQGGQAIKSEIILSSKDIGSGIAYAVNAVGDATSWAYNKAMGRKSSANSTLTLEAEQKIATQEQTKQEPTDAERIKAEQELAAKTKQQNEAVLQTRTEKLAERQKLQEAQAATKIQARWRGNKGRKVAAEAKAEKVERERIQAERNAQREKVVKAAQDRIKAQEISNAQAQKEITTAKEIAAAEKLVARKAAAQRAAAFERTPASPVSQASPILEIYEVPAAAKAVNHEVLPTKIAVPSIVTPPTPLTSGNRQQIDAKQPPIEKTIAASVPLQANGQPIKIAGFESAEITAKKEANAQEQLQAQQKIAKRDAKIAEQEALIAAENQQLDSVTLELQQGLEALNGPKPIITIYKNEKAIAAQLTDTSISPTRQKRLAARAIKKAAEQKTANQAEINSPAIPTKSRTERRKDANKQEKAAKKAEKKLLKEQSTETTAQPAQTETTLAERTQLQKFANQSKTVKLADPAETHTKQSSSKGLSFLKAPRVALRIASQTKVAEILTPETQQQQHEAAKTAHYAKLGQPFARGGQGGVDNVLTKSHQQAVRDQKIEQNAIKKQEAQVTKRQAELENFVRAKAEKNAEREAAKTEAQAQREIAKTKAETLAIQRKAEREAAKLERDQLAEKQELERRTKAEKVAANQNKLSTQLQTNRENKVRKKSKNTMTNALKRKKAQEREERAITISNLEVHNLNPAMHKNFADRSKSVELVAEPGEGQITESIAKQANDGSKSKFLLSTIKPRPKPVKSTVAGLDTGKQPIAKKITTSAANYTKLGETFTVTGKAGVGAEALVRNKDVEASRLQTEKSKTTAKRAEVSRIKAEALKQALKELTDSAPEKEAWEVKAEKEQAAEVAAKKAETKAQEARLAAEKIEAERIQAERKAQKAEEARAQAEAKALKEAKIESERIKQEKAQESAEQEAMNKAEQELRAVEKARAQAQAKAEAEQKAREAQEAVEREIQKAQEAEAARVAEIARVAQEKAEAEAARIKAEMIPEVSVKERLKALEAKRPGKQTAGSKPLSTSFNPTTAYRSATLQPALTIPVSPTS